MGAAPPPQAALLVACWRIQPSSAPSPGSRRDPGSRRGKHICKPCTGTAHLHKRCRRTEDGRRLPVPKRQPTTPQKKTMFPSVSLQTKGKGPQLRLQSRVPKRDINTQFGELGANSRPLQADPAASVLLAGPCLKSEKLKKHVEKTKQNISAAMFHFLYTVHVCLPTVSGKKPL